VLVPAGGLTGVRLDFGLFFSNKETFYFTTSLKSPEGGFERGDYEVVISIEGNASLTRMPFKVV